MSAILFSPHNIGDDETLFAFYQCLRHRPHVIIVLRSWKQLTQQNGPSSEVRELETRCAMAIAGCTTEQWEHPDTGPDWVSVTEDIEHALERHNPEVVIAPAWLLDGHEDHNTIASIVEELMGPARGDLVRYVTYRRGSGRGTDGVEVKPSKVEVALKDDAVACYASQAAHGPTAYWFGDDQREFLA